MKVDESSPLPLSTQLHVVFIPKIVTTQHKKDCHRDTETERFKERLYCLFWQFSLSYYSFALW